MLTPLAPKASSHFVIVTAEKDGYAFIAYYASSRVDRVSRSFMASELQAVVHALAFGKVINETLPTVLGREV